MNNLYLSLLIITRPALVYRVLTFLLFDVRVSDSFIKIRSMKITTKSADRMVALYLELKCFTKMTNTSSNPFQTI